MKKILTILLLVMPIMAFGANVNLSNIPNSSSPPAMTDRLLGDTNGNRARLFTLTQIQKAVTIPQWQTNAQAIGSIQTSNNVTVNGVLVSGVHIVGGYVSVNGNIDSVNGTFYGDGSGLTNLPSGDGSLSNVTETASQVTVNTNLAVSGKILAADGTVDAPSYSFAAGAADSGFYRIDSSTVAYSAQGIALVGFGGSTANNLTIRSGGVLGWSSSSSVSAVPSLYLGRKTSANLRQGDADASAPVSQTFSVQNVGSGTANTAGANRFITGSQSTGTGAGGGILFQTSPAGSSGSAQNALTNRLAILGSGRVGIGTTNPASTLEVVGSVQSQDGFLVASNSYLTIPTLAEGQNWYFSSNAIPHVRYLLGGVATTVRLVP